MTLINLIYMSYIYTDIVYQQFRNPISWTSLNNIWTKRNLWAWLTKLRCLCVVPAANCSWQVSSLSETKAHQVMQQKAASFIHFNQRQLSRIYPSSYRVDSSNFNPQPFWNAGCQLGMSLTQPTAWFLTVFTHLASWMFSHSRCLSRLMGTVVFC